MIKFSGWLDCKMGEWVTTMVGEPPQPEIHWEGRDISEAISFALPFDYLQVIIPSLVECKLSLFVSDKADGVYQPFGQDESTSLTTGGYSTVFVLGGYRHFKIKSSIVQPDECIFKVRGRL